MMQILNEKRKIKYSTAEDTDTRSSPMMSKYEFNSVIGLRATMLSKGAIPLVDVTDLEIKSNMELRSVAIRELNENKLPFIVERQLPGGKSEHWKVASLDLSNVRELMR